MKCLANNSKGSRCQKKGNWKKFGFCDHHSILKSDWFFLKRQVLKLPIGLLIVSLTFILTTILAWEIEEHWSAKRKRSDHTRNSGLENGKNTISEEDFHILILPFGSSDYCEGEKILCERELKRYFKTVIGSDSLAPISVTVDPSFENNYDLIFSTNELIGIGEKNDADLLIWGDYSRRCSWDSTKIIINYLLFDEFAAQYGGIPKLTDSIEGVVENLSQLARGEIVGDVKDVVYWSLGVREALYKRNFEKGIELLKNINSTFKPEYSEYYHLLAYCYQNIGRNEKAIEYYDVVISLDSTNFWPYNNKGAILSANGEFELAVDQFAKGIRVAQSANPNLYYNLSVTLMQLGAIQESAYYLELALEVDPDFQQALITRAQLLAYSGQKEKALEDLNHALDVGETPLIYIEFALYYYSEKNYRKASDYLNKVVNIPPSKTRNPFEYDLQTTMKYLVIQIKILEKIDPTSAEISKLLYELKNIHNNPNNTGISIPSYGEYLSVQFE